MIVSKVLFSKLDVNAVDVNVNGDRESMGCGRELISRSMPG